MSPLIHTILDKIGRILFPPRCLGCARPGEFICPDCRPKTRSRALGRENSSLIFLEAVRSWGSYRNPVLKEALRRLKYHGSFDLSSALAELLKDALEEADVLPAGEKILIFPIPSSAGRVRGRGYNQAELLAKALAEKISLEFEGGNLFKSKPTPSQTSLSGRERILNIRNSFALKNPEQVRGKTIFLVDDILTTGATLSEAARVLREAGTKKIIGLVVARG